MKILILVLLISSAVGAADENDSAKKSSKKKLTNQELMLDSRPKFTKNEEVPTLPKDLKPRQDPQPVHVCTMPSGSTFTMSGPEEYGKCQTRGGTAAVSSDQTKAKEPALGR